MIRINQLKLDIHHSDDDMIQNIARTLKLANNEIQSYKLIKKSIDARDKTAVKFVYIVDVKVKHETKILKRIKNPNVSLANRVRYSLPKMGAKPIESRPVIVGSGPAGLFCAYMLSKYGYKPIVIEQGHDIDKRVSDVEEFWKNNKLDPDSNVQFGEGGAGTFSDGKLNTMVNDKSGRIHKILELFVENGAPEEILYYNKPHIGTDLLRGVVKNMREQIIRHGGEVRFSTKLTDINIENNRLKSIVVNNEEEIPCTILVLAIGHSARDTFTMLQEKQFEISPKAFAVGVRAEHPQELINKNQYGEFYKDLPAADYKLTYRTKNNRSVFSFCMCPGGFVVNASSEKGRLVVNGMSNHDRNEGNANSAIIVNVTPEDFQDSNVLAGMEFQRKLESLAYIEGKGNVPVQTLGDFKQSKTTTQLGSITPNLKGSYTLGNLKNILPEFISESLTEAFHDFDKKIKGFDDDNVLLLGIETRTSSPIRIERNELLESNIKGIYPCGEGAGYAGGITSAAMDGIKVFEAIMSLFSPYIA